MSFVVAFTAKRTHVETANGPLNHLTLSNWSAGMNGGERYISEHVRQSGSIAGAAFEAFNCHITNRVRYNNTLAVHLERFAPIKGHTSWTSLPNVARTYATETVLAAIETAGGFDPIWEHLYRRKSVVADIATIAPGIDRLIAHAQYSQRGIELAKRVSITDGEDHQHPVGIEFNLDVEQVQMRITRIGDSSRRGYNNETSHPVAKLMDGQTQLGWILDGGDIALLL
jgi:hypothetical protein